MEPVTSARGLAETDSWEGGEAAENQTDLLKHEWHHSRGTSARSVDSVHNPGYTAQAPVGLLPTSATRGGGNATLWGNKDEYTMFANPLDGRWVRSPSGVGGGFTVGGRHLCQPGFAYNELRLNHQHGHC